MLRLPAFCFSLTCARISFKPLLFPRFSFHIDLGRDWVLQNGPRHIVQHNTKMADSLASALNQLSLNTKGLDPASVDVRLAEEEAGKIERRKPRKQSSQSADDLLKDLEDDFLKPSATFSPKWLNQLQK